jgi:AraC-like DNA-binding protein
VGPPGTGDLHRIGDNTREWMVDHRDCPALAAHRILVIGRSHARAGFAFVRRRPDVAQVLLCERGRGRVWVEGAWATCGPGQAYLTPGGVPHAYHALAGAPWQVTWVMFAAAPDAPPPLPTARPVLATVDPRPLADAVRGLYRENVRHHGAAAPAPAALHHYAALIALMAARPAEPWRADRDLVRLWEEVDADLARPWTATTLAARAGLGPEQLRRRCHRALGRSPLAHLAVLRMRRAAALLTTSAAPVATVAAAVGYANPFAFSTAFRRVLGLPPSAYRRPGA